MAGNKFLKGAAILGIAGILVKVMGVFFRLPLTNWIGAEGISYYSSVYPIYVFFLTLSTAGIPVAISKMVSERVVVKNYGGAHKVFHTSLWLMAAFGFASFMMVHFGAGFIEETVLKNPGTSLSLQAIAPSLFFVPIMSAYRGYFQGRQNMNPTALSQFFEQLFRVVVGLSLAYYLIPTGLEATNAGATFGCTAGAVAGLVVVIGIYLLNLPAITSKIHRNKSNERLESTATIIKRLLVIAVPITIGASILPLMETIDSAVVMRRLQASGWSLVESKVLWGRLGGYCNSLIGLPQAFTQAVVMSLVPAIAAGFSLGNLNDVKETSKLGMRTAMLISFPCAVGMFSLAEPILHLLYPSQLAEATASVPTLRIMCIGIIFMSALQTLTGALQGVDRQTIPVRNLAIGSLVKLVLTYVLVGLRPINVNGGPIGTIVAYVIATALNAAYLKKDINIKFDYSMTYFKPALASALMGIAAFAGYKLMFLITASNTISTILAIALGAVVYVVLIFVIKAITKEELARLPKGDKLVKIIDKFIK